MYATITEKSLPLVEIKIDDLLIEVDKCMRLEKENEDFSSYLKAMMNEKKVTISRLAGMSGYSDELITKSLYNYRDIEDGKLHKRFVISICIALRLSAREAEILLKRAGYGIDYTNTDKWNMFVTHFLCDSSHCKEMDVTMANCILVYDGMEPLLPYNAMRYVYWDVFYDVETNEIV